MGDQSITSIKHGSRKVNIEEQNKYITRFQKEIHESIRFIYCLTPTMEDLTTLLHKQHPKAKWKEENGRKKLRESDCFSSLKRDNHKWTRNLFIQPKKSRLQGRSG